MRSFFRTKKSKARTESEDILTTSQNNRQNTFGGQNNECFYFFCSSHRYDESPVKFQKRVYNVQEVNSSDKPGAARHRQYAMGNDATREDAAAVSIPFPVIDNGNRIPGTQIDQLSPEAKQALEEADVIIAKGQGNFETLYFCGLNVYYLFMCKCDLFANRFQVPRFTGMLLNDRKMNW